MSLKTIVFVNGKNFTLSAENYERIKHTMASNGAIDRDPKIFKKYVWPYLLGYRMCFEDTSKETLWRIWSDARVYRLPELETQVGELLGPTATCTQEEIDAKIEKKIKSIKDTYTSIAKFVGAAFGGRLNNPDLTEELMSELADFDSEIVECAKDLVTRGGPFGLSIDPSTKFMVALAMKLYFKLFMPREQVADENDIPEHAFVPYNIDPNLRVNIDQLFNVRPRVPEPVPRFRRARMPMPMNNIYINEHVDQAVPPDQPDENIPPVAEGAALRNSLVNYVHDGPLHEYNREHD